MKNFKIATKDNIKTIDKLGVYKRWFNGVKYFALKILPKNK